MTSSSIYVAMLILCLLVVFSSFEESFQQPLWQNPQGRNEKQDIKMPKMPRPSKMDAPIRIPGNGKGGSPQRRDNSNMFGYKLGLSPSPGNVFLFWHVLVPATVLLHILHFGIRGHEFVTLLALLFNPVLVKYIAQNSFLSSVAVLFLLMVVLHLMRTRWSFHKIYAVKFFVSLALLIVFLVLPDFFQSVIWRYMHGAVLQGMRWLLRSSSQQTQLIFTDTIMLMVAVLMFLHSIIIYKCYGHCPKPVSRRAAVCPSKNCNCCLRNRIYSLYQRLFCCCGN